MAAVESTVDGVAWQRSWDRQQEGYLPDREQRFAAMLEAVEALAADRTRPLRVLDLAGGTGSISLRLLRRRPDCDITVVDLDPVLLRIARASLPETVVLLAADLRDPTWHRHLPGGGFDAVLTATALHWLTADRLASLYAELHRLITPGGILINADHMPDDGLPTVTAALIAHDRQRRGSPDAAPTWEQWWAEVAADPVLGRLKQRRDDLLGHHHTQEWTPQAPWHLTALREAGFAEVGLVWRAGTDAAVAALRG
jgi:SAM-dependent methyltransferase